MLLGYLFSKIKEAFLVTLVERKERRRVSRVLRKMLPRRKKEDINNSLPLINLTLFIL